MAKLLPLPVVLALDRREADDVVFDLARAWPVRLSGTVYCHKAVFAA